MRDGKLTVGQVRPVLALTDEAEQLAMAQQIVQEGLSARKSEELAKQKKDKKKPAKEDQQVAAYLHSIEEKLGLSVGSRVRIKWKQSKQGHKGTISIAFKSEEEFERITELLNR